MVINVTQEHIDRGTKKECSKCPVALALKDAGFPNAFVGVFSIWPFEMTRLDVSNEVEEFIAAFDCGSIVKPFSFNLELPA